MKRSVRRCALVFGFAVLAASPGSAQLPGNSRFGNGQFMPLAPVPPTGQPVVPFFEGWFRNPDGTFTFSFGYFNINTREIVDVPIGPDNFIEPAEFNGVQPTHFPSNPRRDPGLFQVTVPAEYEDATKRVVWTISSNGFTNSVPARTGYEPLELDYLPRAMGSVPPEIRFARDGEVGSHIKGLWSEPRTATVGEPMMITLWGREVSVRRPDDIVNRNIYLTVTWFKYQGPDDEVTFSPQSIKIESGNGRATTNATFSAPGEYVLRGRVENWNSNDSSAGDQCCWTNAYVRVTVTGG